MFPPRALVFLLATSVMVSQHRAWYVNAPASGPFDELLAVIGDRDADGHADVVRSVVFVPPAIGYMVAHAWTFSGRTGQLLTAGPMGAGVLFTAGDVNHDGCGDYVIAGPSAPFPACGPTPCRGFDARSGLDDSVLWHVDLPGVSGLGHMAVGDIDLDGDGRPDALIGSNYGGGVIHAVSSRGRRLYQITGLPSAPFGPGLGKFIDYDHDGCDDFVLGMYVQPNGAVDIRSGRNGSLLRRFQGPTPIWAYGATAAMTGDLDGDGIPDIIAGDSGPFTPGVLAVLSSSSGAVLWQWQVNAIGAVGRDDFGWPHVACADVDRDGIADVIANSRSGNMGQFIFSGRDGSLIEHYYYPGDFVVGPVEAMPPQGNDPFPRYACHGATNTATGMHLFSGAPQGVTRTGLGSSGTLANMPMLGLRELLPSGFRVTLSGAEPGAFAILVIGFTQPSPPYFDLSLLGFPGSFLYPQPDVLGCFQAGVSWPQVGYAKYEFPQDLVTPSTPGAVPAYLQWVVFGSGASWPGGVSEAMQIFFR
jgi:hypothetical protein